MVRYCSMIGIFLMTMNLSMPARGQSSDDKENGSGWRAGAAAVAITPHRRLPMAGYAARKEPAEGKEQELYAKALALEDQHGGRVMIITLDLIGVVESLRSRVAASLEEKWKLPPGALLMNASHTHCGPAYSSPEAADYFELLCEQLVEVSMRAVANMEPAKLAHSHGYAGFAMNRRTPSGDRYLNHPNPDGPVDHSVPVLNVQRQDGKSIAVLFGYACHNTTMGFLKWLGDYAGYAQEYLEADHQGVVAMFMMGCGGDQNPYPRRELIHAQRHGRSLATAVEAALEIGQSTPRHQKEVRGPIRCAYDTVDLEFAVAERPDFAYPVQAIRLGDDLMLVALGSEVTIDYAHRLKRELHEPGGASIWVAGYSNIYAGYIPSRRVLLEGGYEAESRPWKPSLEGRIVSKVHQVVAETKGEELFVARPFTEPQSFTAGIEGPACDADGNLYAVNFAKQQTIGRISPTGVGEIFVTLPGTSTGNGIRFDRRGTMYVADYVGHNVLTVDPISREVAVFAHDDRMNQPNDLAIAVDGTLYASDPNWKESTGQIWRIDRDGSTHRLIDGLGTTNGIDLSPDNKILYVNETVQRNVWAFEITEDKQLVHKRLVRQFPDHGFDGMRVDIDGNLYVTRYGKGTVVKLSPEGDILCEIDVLGKKPSNICFGGEDGRTAYVTEVEHQRVVSFRVDRPGFETIGRGKATAQR